MKTQCFILGRNPLLSKEEIVSYLETRNIKFEIEVFEENLLILKIAEIIPIQELGGTIRGGEISHIGTIKEIENFLNSEELIPADKFTYAIYGNLEPEPLKEKFKVMRKRAIQKHGRKRVKFQGGEKQELPNADFHILFHEEKGKVYLGILDLEYNYENVIKRDMEKPVRREALAISPRLSKILINLSGAKENNLLLDPFCGVGAILSEALIMNIDVYGIDRDKNAIRDAEKNLAWLKKNFEIKKNYTLQNMDSRKATNLKFDAVATETPLGVLVKKKLNDKEAKKIIQNFESLIIPILSRLKKVKKASAKIAITFPRIRDIKVDAQKVCEKTGLKIIIPAIQESRKDQYIGREIIVLK